ncbi:hypothetical protein GCM10020000_29400 [Streptomyces olivoverticillatus]
MLAGPAPGEATLPAGLFKIIKKVTSQHATHCHPRWCANHGLEPVMVETPLGPVRIPPRTGPFFSFPFITLRVGVVNAGSKRGS